MQETITLNNGINMPRLGLGVYKATSDGEVQNAIKDAVSIGYRLIDTASFYKNEEGVGEGIRKCGIPRKELFVTTKVWNNAQRLGDVENAFNRSLDRLGRTILTSIWSTGRFPVVPSKHGRSWKTFTVPAEPVPSVLPIITKFS